MRTRRNTVSGCKGQTPAELILVILILTVMAIVAVLGYKVLTDAKDEMLIDPDINPEAQSALENVHDQYPNFMDRAFLLAVVLFWAMLIVTSFLIDSHPIFFILSIILLLFTFVIGMVMSNTYEEFTADPDLSTAAQSFPITNWVIGNLLMVVIVIGLTTAVALYAKNQL